MHQTQLIHPARFDRNRGEWLPVPNPDDNIASDVLTFATFNTWFGEYHFAERIRAISEILRESNADIIALQEITTASMELLLKEDWIKDAYFISDISGSTFYSYGVILLSRIPMKKLILHSL